MELSLVTTDGGAAKKIEVSSVIFGREDADCNASTVHQVVNAYQAGGRSGTKAQLNRANVNRGGAKPWKQKGTGRARAGTTKSPIWVGGGRAFAAQPRDFKQKVNKKMYRSAMRSILSTLVRQDRLVVVEKMMVDKPKTKELLSQLKGLGVNDALIIVNELDTNLYLASRNMPRVSVCPAQGLDPVRLIKFGKVVVTVQALRKLEESLG